MDFFRGRHSWRKLAGLLQRLPSWSKFAEAQANDDEVADMLLQMSEAAGGGRRGPSLSEYPPDVARLDVIVDRLGELLAATIAAGGAKPPRVQPMPRPSSAIERARERARNAYHDALVAEVELAQERWKAAQGRVTG